MMAGRSTTAASALGVEHMAEVQLLLRFRAWMKQVYGKSTDMFEALDTTGAKMLTCETFVEELLEKGRQLEAHPPRGFSADPGFPGQAELVEVYGLLDYDDGGELARNEVTPLDSEESTCKTALAKVKSREALRKMRVLGQVWHSCGRLPETHRRARRPWQAETFERLPALSCARREARRSVLFKRKAEARRCFNQHLVSMHGHEVRAWRKELDPKGTFELSQKVFYNYCRRTEAPIDTQSLWQAIDRDGDKCIRLEELAPEAAEVLAKFREWAVLSFGSVTAIWDRPELRELRENVPPDAKWPTRKKMLVSDLLKGLNALGSPHAADPTSRRCVVKSLDVYGCGFVEKRDFQWLDSWNPPSWIVQEPDPDAWEDLRRHMLEKYKHPLRAWRTLLDADDSNQVSWLELREACDRIKWQGNIGGVWRHLDADLSGSISMREYDEHSSELLESFKQWCDVHFGSARQCFYSLYDKNTGFVPFPALKKACRRLRWEGDPKELMEFLDLDKHHANAGPSKKSLVLKDILFLDKWIVEAQEDEVEEDAPELPTPVLEVAPKRSASAPDLRRAAAGRRDAKAAAEKAAAGTPPESSAPAPASPSTVEAKTEQPAAKASPPAPALPRVSAAQQMQRTYRYSHKSKRATSDATPWLTKILSFD